MPTFRVSINRPLDLEKFTDRLALGSLFVFGVAGYWQGGWPEAVQAGLAAYLCWALCREIDPDHPGAANLGALSGGTLSLALETDAGVMLVVLLSIKVLVGGSGLSPARWEAALLGAASMVFAGTPTGWWAAMVMSAALLLDTSIAPVARSEHRYLAAAVVMGASVVYLLLTDADPWWWASLVSVVVAGLIVSYFNLNLNHRLMFALVVASVPALARIIAQAGQGNLDAGPWWVYGWAAGCLVFGLAAAISTTEVQTSTDHAKTLISSERVRIARFLLVALLVVSWAFGSDGDLVAATETAAPIGAALIWVGVGELLRRTILSNAGTLP